MTGLVQERLAAAADLAQGALLSADAAADLSEVLRQMAEHRITRLPVIENHVW